MLELDENDSIDSADYSWRTSTPLDKLDDLFYEDLTFHSSGNEDDSNKEELIAEHLRLFKLDRLLEPTELFVHIAIAITLVCKVCVCQIPMVKDYRQYRKQLDLHINGKRHCNYSVSQKVLEISSKKNIMIKGKLMSNFMIFNLFYSLNLAKAARYFNGFIQMRPDCMICQCSLGVSNSETKVKKLIKEHVTGKMHQNNLNKINSEDISSKDNVSFLMKSLSIKT